MHWTHLFWNLSKIVDEANGEIILERIINSIDVNIAPVKQLVEHIDCLDSCWPLLFVSKYQIYPLMEVGTHIVTLQGLDQRTQTCSVNLYLSVNWSCTHINLEYTEKEILKLFLAWLQFAVFYCNRQIINVHSLL